MMADEPTTSRPPTLRLWPGIVIVALQWTLRFVFPFFDPEFRLIGIFAAFLCGLLVVALVATFPLVDPSIRTGMMGTSLFMYAVPVLCLAFVLWAVASRGLADAPRRAARFAWRWAATSEERLMAADRRPLERI